MMVPETLLAFIAPTHTNSILRHNHPIRPSRPRATRPVRLQPRDFLRACLPLATIKNAQQTPSSSSSPSPCDLIFDDPSLEYLLHSGASPASIPLLFYIPGLDAQPLPQCQEQRLKDRYITVSVVLKPNDRSSWQQLVDYIIPRLSTLCANVPSGVTLFGESFGAALALRLAATAHPGTIKHLVLLNSATSLQTDGLLRTLTNALQVLRIDPSSRILYKAVAAIAFNNLLTNSERLADSSVPRDVIPFLRSFDIEKVPLPSLYHRIELLKNFATSFDDECVRKNVTVSTTLIASRFDRLLQSVSELERLESLLPNVKRTVILEESAHAALLEENVDILHLLQAATLEDSPSDMSAEELRRYHIAMDFGKSFYEPWRSLVSPLVLGQEYLKEALDLADRGPGKTPRPVLFVGNHGVHGILDTSLIFLQLTDSIPQNRRLRPLADASHFELYSEISGGRWTKFAKDLGAVRATPRNFYRLLAKGELILLFPGGAREVCRRRGENNTLCWDSDTQFVRPSAKFDAVIVPFSSVGADDSVDIIIDGQEIQALPWLGRQVQEIASNADLSTENLMPVTSFPPRPDRFYFQIHEPIDTSELNWKNEDKCQSAYEEVRTAVKEGLSALQDVRARDPNRGIVRRRISEKRGTKEGTETLLDKALDAFLSGVGL